MGLMLSDDVKQISMGALQQINLDTIQCERKFSMLEHKEYIYIVS